MSLLTDLTKVIRTEVKRLDGCTVDDDAATKNVVETVLTNLKAAGFKRNDHVGVDFKRYMPNKHQITLEWYAGQIIDVLEAQSWFAVNSIINCLDKFAPELPDDIYNTSN